MTNTIDKNKYKVFISHSWGQKDKGCINPQAVKQNISKRVNSNSWECIIDLNKNTGSIRDLMDKIQSSDLAVFFISEQFFTSIDCVYEAVSAAQSYRLKNQIPDIIIYFDILDDGIILSKDINGHLETCYHNEKPLKLSQIKKNECCEWLIDYWKKKHAEYLSTNYNDFKDKTKIEDLEKFALISSENYRDLKTFTSLCFDYIRSENTNDIIDSIVEKINHRFETKTQEHYTLGPIKLDDQLYILPNNNEVEVKKEDSCIWMTDAEKACSTQKGFNATCYNHELLNFIKQDSNIVGLHSIKGIGKTYALQMKYRELEKTANCYPKRNSHDNDNLGMEKLTLEKDLIPTWLNTCKAWEYLWELVLYLYLLISVSKQYGKHKVAQDLFSRSIYYKHYEKIDSSYSLISELFRDIIELIQQHNTRTEETILSIIRKEINTLKSIWKKKYEVIYDKLDKKQFAIFIDRIDQLFSNRDIRRFHCDNCMTIEHFEKCFSCISKNDLILDLISQSSGETKSADCFHCKEGCYSCPTFFENNTFDYLTAYITSWFYAQRSIIQVSSKINTESENTILIYYAVRSEAVRTHILRNNAAEHIKKFSQIIELKYDRKMQENIYNKYIQCETGKYLFDENYKEKNADYAFVGIGTLRHPYTKTCETVFDSIIRHSFNRTRDIQNFGIQLSKAIPELKSSTSEEERCRIVERIINDTAANLVYCDSGESFYNEKKIFMPTYWRNDENFISLLKRIKSWGKNVFVSKDIVSICKQINNKSSCNKSCSQCSHHPFSFLYRFKMLGYVTPSPIPSEMVTQTFINGNEISFWEETNELQLNDDFLYFLHPSVTKTIEENIQMKRQKIKHFNQFIIGEGLQVRSDILANTIKTLNSDNANSMFGPKNN